MIRVIDGIFLKGYVYFRQDAIYTLLGKDCHAFFSHLVVSVLVFLEVKMKDKTFASIFQNNIFKC